MSVIFSTEISAKRQHFLSFPGGLIYLYDVNTVGYIISVLRHFKIILNKCPKKKSLSIGNLALVQNAVYSRTKDIFNKGQAQYVFFYHFD